MEKLWAPWRMEYIGQPCQDGCIFCLTEECEQDEQRLILHRSEHAFVIMNKYPYSNGHLMVAPYRHTVDMSSLSAEEVLDMHQLLIRCQAVLQKTFNPQGFNIGINLGRDAGAGVIDHLHQHIVPRWQGDTNFMPLFADVRVIPQHLEKTYAILFAEFQGGTHETA